MPIPGAPALRQASPEARTAGGVFCGAVKDMAGRDRIPLISSPPPLTPSMAYVRGSPAGRGLKVNI